MIFYLLIGGAIAIGIAIIVYFFVYRDNGPTRDVPVQRPPYPYGTVPIDPSSVQRVPQSVPGSKSIITTVSNPITPAGATRAYQEQPQQNPDDDDPLFGSFSETGIDKTMEYPRSERR
jgi:hypothetical protein